ncbi:MAG: InlB B-repeat-containing protein, partial [Clostridiales bacterium]|nr:InlB B-repeat-containing protein [Clostridiales bacterium]
ANVYTDGNIYTNDSVEVIFAAVGRKVSYADVDKTISVIVSAKGETLVKNLSTNQTVEIAGVVTAAKVITLDGTTVAGYRVEITMPYDAAGISQANKNAALLLGYTNASNAGNAKYAYETSLGTESGKLNTFIAVKDNNKFEPNSFTELGTFWGNGGGALTAKDSWNLEYDDGVSNEIEMTKLDGDNNIYMRSTNTAEYYAEVQLHANNNAHGDKWPKFGLTIFKVDGTEGLMYYVDAEANESDGNTFNSGSTKLGYVFYDNSTKDKWVWPGKTIGDLSDDSSLGNNVTSSAYTDGYITLGIYRHNSDFQFYVGETPLEVITLNGYTSSYAGLASFNVLLSAKNYSVKTNAEELAAYRKTLEDSKGAKVLDGKLDDWTQEDKSNPFELPASDGQSVTVYATKDSKGVYVYYDAYHKTHKTTEGEWWMNTNVEFYLGGAEKQYYISANGTEGNIGKNNYSFRTVQEDSIYHTVAEIFIPYAEIVGEYSEDTLVPARFLFKVGGNFGNVWYEGDWWRTDDGNTNQGILITNDGILGGANKTIDADDSDWENADWTTAGRAQWAATLEEDGLYLFIKLTGTIANDRAYFSGADNEGKNNNWWLNQNIEIMDNVVSGLRAAKIVYVGGKAYHTAFVNDAAANYTAGTGNGDDKLDFEIFIARENFKEHDARTLTANIGGQLFADATSTANAYQTYISNVAIGAALYTVTYDYKNGSENTTQQVVKGDAVGTLPTASKTGFTFDGWYNGETKVDASFVPTGAVTLVAKWNPIAPTITWSSGNAAATGTNPSVAATYDSTKEVYKLVLPATNPYTLTDHTFSKWDVTVQGVAGSKQYNLGATAEVPSGSTVTVKVIWVEVGKTYRTVTFKLGYTEGDADYDETRSVEDNTTVSELPTDPTRTGYRFDGWYLSDNTTKFTTATTVTADVTVTAKWVQQVTVSFNIGYTGGTNPTSITLDKDGKITTLPSAGTRTYYEFKGWFYGENNATQLTTSTTVSSNLSVTGKWEHKGDKNVEYLFLGDSIISTMADDGTDFYYLWKAQFGSLNAANIGVPGSKALEWVQKLNGEEVEWLKNVNLLQYNAEKIIIHVGVNDINDGSYSEDYVRNQLD